jgi:hypothetical protein
VLLLVAALLGITQLVAGWASGAVGHIWWLAISMYGACERVYLLYRIYSIHARARASLLALVVLYALHHYTYILYYLMYTNTIYTCMCA